MIKPAGTDYAPVSLAIVWWLAALAGAVDASGLSLLKDLFVSFMSGNTTSLGVALASGDWPRVGLIGGIVAAFVAGAIAGTVLAHAAGRYQLPAVTLVVAGILAVPLAVPLASAPAMTFAMGTLNAAMAGSVKVSITFVTGALVKFGQGIGDLLCGKAKDWNWSQQAVPWTGLLAGAIVAASGMARYGQSVFAALPMAALGMALVSWFALPHAADI
jgi:uncharacterized membrane protein YoaK (UPF0700 family)